LCIGIGVWPEPLYAILPYPVDFIPYTTEHVITQLQLLLFSGLAFTWLMRSDLYPPERRSVNLDTDVVYRRFLPHALIGLRATLAEADGIIRQQLLSLVLRIVVQVRRQAGPTGLLARSGPVGGMVPWVVGLLGIFLILNFL
jgi:multicomponent Na+:H+ antiporter subunit D